MTRFFGAMASEWDTRADHPGRLEPLYKALDAVERHPRHVLDIGCGTGAAALALSERFPDAWVEGIDISEQMIAEARRKAREYGAAVQFDVACGDRLETDDHSIDLVVLMNALPAFGEISRVLTEHGSAVVVFSAGQSTPFYSKPGRLRRGFARNGMDELASGTAGSGEFFVAGRRERALSAQADGSESVWL